MSTPTWAARWGGPAEPAFHIRAITQGGQASGFDPVGNTLVQGQIYDPNSTRLVNGTQVRSLYPGNQIPAQCLDPGFPRDSEVDSPTRTCPVLVNNYAQSSPSRGYTHTTNLSLSSIKTSVLTIRIFAYYSQINNFSPFTNGLPPGRWAVRTPTTGTIPPLRELRLRRSVRRCCSISASCHSRPRNRT